MSLIKHLRITVTKRCFDHSRLRPPLQVAGKTAQHKFGGHGQRKTPAATIENIVYILSRMSGEVGHKLADLGAACSTGLIGGDLRLAEATIAARAEQERLAVEDPKNPLRLFGEKAEAEGGASESLKDRLDWRPVRSDEKATNKALMDQQVAIGAGGAFIPRIQNLINKGTLGFQQATTTEFKLDNQIEPSQPLGDHMSGVQLGARCGPTTCPPRARPTHLHATRARGACPL